MCFAFAFHFAKGTQQEGRKNVVYPPTLRHRFTSGFYWRWDRVADTHALVCECLRRHTHLLELLSTMDTLQTHISKLAAKLNSMTSGLQTEQQWLKRHYVEWSGHPILGRDTAKHAGTQCTGPLQTRQQFCCWSIIVMMRSGVKDWTFDCTAKHRYSVDVGIVIIGRGCAEWHVCWWLLTQKD